MRRVSPEPSPEEEEEEEADNTLWVPHNPQATLDTPEATGTDTSFDIYIDAVRFLPDSASIVKVR